MDFNFHLVTISIFSHSYLDICICIYAYQVENKEKTLMDLCPTSAFPILILYLNIIIFSVL